MHTLDILVTHYNEDSSIVNRFLSSLDEQTYKDLQVTIVDDGLDCPSVIFDRQYGFEIKHLKFPHKTVSKARNNALDNTSAKYLMFCDCDDMFYSGNSCGLAAAMTRILENNLDIYRTRHYCEVWKNSGNNQLLSAVHSDNETNDELILKLYAPNVSAVHSKIYKREFVEKNNIRFLDDMYINEDGAFNTLAYSICKMQNGKLFNDCESFYIWKYNKNSVTRTNQLYPILGYDQYIKVTAYSFRKQLSEIEKLKDPADQADKFNTFNDGILHFIFQGYYWLYLYSDKFLGKEGVDKYLHDDIDELKNFINEFKEHLKISDIEKEVNQKYIDFYMSKIESQYTDNKEDFRTWLEHNLVERKNNICQKLLSHIME